MSTELYYKKNITTDKIATSNNSPAYFTIYLAGYYRDLEYRKLVKSKYGHRFNFMDPMTITIDEVYDFIGEELSDIFIVRRDKKMIDQCDILVAKIEYVPEKQIQVGTIMEIMYAHMKGIPVFLVSSELDILNNPWLKFHSSGLFNSVDECFEFILKK
jgi:nucleoside 2-deoxyribosyltransferase